MTSPSSREDRTTKRPQIAVVAVHGVGEHPRGESARAVADLLTRTQSDVGGLPRYSGFQESSIRIPTKPAVVGDRSRPHSIKGLRTSIFSEQSAYIRIQHARRPGDSDHRSTDLPEHQFMRAQLAEYESSGQPYETIRLNGERVADHKAGTSGEPEAHVHVYEMGWSDISQLGGGGVTFFGALYQLLFHLAHLGRVAVDHALIEFRGQRLWKAFAFTHRWAVRTLTVFIPALWLAMLASILGGIVIQISQAAKPLVVALTIGSALITVALVMAYRTSAEDVVRIDPVLPGIAIVATIVLAIVAFHLDVQHLNRALLVAWIVLAGGILHLVFRAYERVRPGVWVVGMVTYVVSGGATLVRALPAADQPDMFARIAHVFEVETAAIVAVWYSLYALGALAAVLGLIALYRTPANTSARTRVSDVLWTARTTLAASSSMVLVVTFVMWAAILGLTRGMLPAVAESAVLPIFRRPGSTYGNFFENLLRVTAGPGFTVLLVIICVIAIVAIVALFPAVIKEVYAPRAGERFRFWGTQSRTPPKVSAKNRQLRDDAASQKLGGWLTGGFGAIGIASGVLFVAMFVLLPTLNIIDYLAQHDRHSVLEYIEGWALQVILTAGGSLTAAAVGLVGFRNRLDALALGFRPVVDAALDVDNYLREHPRTNTPRARIAERYTSLLRYLCSWRDARSGDGYAAIILVTHSQGTVISADLLNFIQLEPDPELEELRHGGSGHPAVYLFTMGSPLRQLYAQCFPHLFGWVRGDLSDWFTRRGAPVAPAKAIGPAQTARRHVVSSVQIPEQASPHPWDLGATRWVNAYRSGDYVGRSLWRIGMQETAALYRCAPASMAGTNDDQPTILVSEDATRARRELCIGVGAHTHYWDATAQAIASELDLLIAEATANAATRVSDARVHDTSMK